MGPLLVNAASIASGRDPQRVDGLSPASLWGATGTVEPAWRDRAKRRIKWFAAPSTARRLSGAARAAGPAGAAAGEAGAGSVPPEAPGEAGAGSGRAASDVGGGPHPGNPRRPRGRGGSLEATAGAGGGVAQSRTPTSRGFALDAQTKRAKSSKARAASQRTRPRKGTKQAAADGVPSEGTGGEAQAVRRGAVAQEEKEEEEEAEEEGEEASEAEGEAPPGIGGRARGVSRGFDEEFGGVAESPDPASQAAANSTATVGAKTAGRRSQAEPRAYEGPMPAAHVEAAAAPVEKRIRELAFTGKWQEAIDLLASIR